MLSRDERKAVRVARNAAVDARTSERLARVEAKGAERQARIAAWSARHQPAPASAAPLAVPGSIEGAPGVYRPSMSGELAAMTVPGVGVFQAIKGIKSQMEFLDSLSPEQRAKYLRRTPGISGS